MAMSATYTSFAGSIVKETRGGSVKRYVADTLGSTAKLTNTSGTVTDSFEYWPYGEERSRTGTTATPFTFVGTLGYYKDVTGRLYVRARILMAKYARWLTVDPQWPDASAYVYVYAMPARYTDPTGLGVTFPCSWRQVLDCVKECEDADLMFLSCYVEKRLVFIGSLGERFYEYKRHCWCQRFDDPLNPLPPKKRWWPWPLRRPKPKGLICGLGYGPDEVSAR
jgi:RHS repeat-associated protein